MKLASSAFALSLIGLAACGAFAASASVPLAALSAGAAIDTEKESEGRLMHTASNSPIGYYAVRTH